jgi:hypothetical protein
MYGCPYRYRYLLFLTKKWFLAEIWGDGLGWAIDLGINE